MERVKNSHGSEKVTTALHTAHGRKIKFANELNEFYCRFERRDLQNETLEVVNVLRERGMEGEGPSDDEIETSVVEEIF